MKRLKNMISVMICLLVLLSGETIIAKENGTMINVADTIAALESDPNTYETSLTEEEFVKCLKDQGFIVEKKGSTQTRAAVAATGYIVKKPLTRNSAPANGGKVPGNHFIKTTYKTVNGWNYFVSFEYAGVELSSSSYGKENENSTWTQTHGGQGVTWETTLQYTYTTSKGISVSTGWFGGSVGSSYIYRTNLVTEKSSFNFPIMK